MVQKRILACVPVLIVAIAALYCISCAREDRETGGDRTSGVEQDITGSIQHDGVERTYLIHLPPAYDGEKALPLLFAFHGGGGDGEGMPKLTHLNDIADDGGFIVVYPDGINNNWNDGRPEVNPGVDDVGFISALIDELETTYGIDATRVYSTGISNGGMFSLRLACELAEKIAAVAPVAALMGENLSRTCAPARPVPVMFIMGTADPLVPWEGGKIEAGRLDRGYVLSAAGSVSFWVEVNGCSRSPVLDYLPDEDPDDGTKVRRETYGGGHNGTEVVLLAIEGGGHTWPGGMQYRREQVIGLTSRDIDAGEIMWDFFIKFTSPAL
jgi:polyhydroxybutyrate depolymerase